MNREEILRLERLPAEEAHFCPSAMCQQVREMTIINLGWTRIYFCQRYCGQHFIKSGNRLIQLKLEEKVLYGLYPGPAENR
jgi:hypothetical protein